MPPRNSAIMRPLLDGMDKIKTFRRDVVAIVCKASEMTRGPTCVCPHKFSCILRPITVSGSSRASVGANRSTPYFCFPETKIRSQETKFRFLESQEMKICFLCIRQLRGHACHQANPAGICGFQLRVLAIFGASAIFQRAQSLNHEQWENLLLNHEQWENLSQLGKMYCYIFPLKMYGYILESRVVGEHISESRVVGEPIVACGNGFQFPSLYRRKRFSVSCEVGRERRKWFSVSIVVQTETVFSFPRVRRRTEETVFSFRTIF